MFIPSLGVVAGVTVVDEADSELDVATVIAEAIIEPGLAAPFPIESFTTAADDSSDTTLRPESVTVNISGDATLSTDTAELSAQADTGQDTVTLDLPETGSGETRLPLRLTDISVKEA
ncbi:MAG: hypothetical protein Q4C85_05380 [Actinomyces sp.]|uniref:hypothetical protein n=1 Tax=Actinomyces sp. TaxID=29317 RepID=UPI0026DB4CBB|nr:hypothetical protein [Actinomyces sp.]MDO4243183.1 hypothetical protein [Actinomyces sp.]